MFRCCFSPFTLIDKAFTAQQVRCNTNYHAFINIISCSFIDSVT